MRVSDFGNKFGQPLIVVPSITFWKLLKRTDLQQ